MTNDKSREKRKYNLCDHSLYPTPSDPKLAKRIKKTKLRIVAYCEDNILGKSEDKCLGMSRD